MPIQEENSIQSLVLGARRNTAVDGQVTQKCLDRGMNSDIHISESLFGPGLPVGVREGNLGRLPFVLAD